MMTSPASCEWYPGFASMRNQTSCLFCPIQRLWTVEKGVKMAAWIQIDQTKPNENASVTGLRTKNAQPKLTHFKISAGNSKP